ncbi:MAG: PD-(D/E)XK nuclease family protein [Bacteroidales bacterium]|nr:PD-(D/E)XK nuclease family protein [Bacteroidales bacterium]
MSFLSDLAAEIIDSQTIDYRNVAVVLPNKRAQKALDGEMARIAGKIVFPPVVFSIDELVTILSGLDVLPMSELLLELYGVYEQVAAQHSTQPDDFQKFMTWGANLIGDFNDIDKQLADAREIFSYLKDFKDIGVEIDSGGQPTAGQIRYMEFYGMLYDLYSSFGEALRKKGKAYPGLVYRVAAENISEQSVNLAFAKYYFAGLNAMAPAEAYIIHHLYLEGKVQFIFDFDRFYFEYTAQIRDVLSKMFQIQEKDIRFIGNHFADSPKHICTYGVSKRMNQIYEAVDILNRIEEKSQDDLNRTAVVFADEGMIVPFVHCYDYRKCNISKKYPARATGAYRLLQVLLGMAVDWQRLQKQTDDDGGKDSSDAAYYHKDVLALYRDPIVVGAFFSDETEQQQFIRSLVRTNQLFFSRRTLNERLPDSCPDVTGSSCALVGALSGYFRLIAGRLSDNFCTDKKMMLLFADALDRAAEILSRYDAAKSAEVRTVEFFLNEQIDMLDLSFRGDRSSGVQVMGLLETRTLDFDHVVLLSANEGIIPSGNVDNSLILYEIKRKFHLSTYEQNDAIYGYHFFHLLQRAKDIHIIYNADTTDELAEESRFIKQIYFKKQKMGLDNLMFEQVVRPPRALASNDAQSDDLRSIANSDEIRAKLLKFQFSASSLNTYINCPLQFYLRYVARIIPEEDIKETVDQNVIGLVIHRALELLGNEAYKATPEQAEALVEKWMQKVQGDSLSELFNELDEVRGQDLSRGRIYIATQVVRTVLENYLLQLKKELGSGNTQIIGCECGFSCTLKVGDYDIALTGKADRIDKHGNKVSILDYKSGHSNSTSFQCIEDLFTKTDKSHVFQLFFYRLLYNKRDREIYPPDRFPDGELESGIVYLRNALLNKKATQYATLKNPTKEKLKEMAEKGETIPTLSELTMEFEKCLKELIKTIMEKDSFQPARDEQHCMFCDYKKFCKRDPKKFF